MPPILMINLVHKTSGAIKWIEVLGRDFGKGKFLALRWPLCEIYSLDVVKNELLLIDGNRIRRRLKWKAVDPALALDMWSKLSPKRLS